MPKIISLGISRPKLTLRQLGIAPVAQNQSYRRKNKHDRHQCLIGIKATHLGRIQAQEIKQDPDHWIADQIDKKKVSGF